jgi:hypothetical protein
MVPGATDARAAVSRAQVRQPVNARGRWRTYAARLAPLIAELEMAGALEGWDHPPLRQPEPPQL